MHTKEYRLPFMDYRPLFAYLGFIVLYRTIESSASILAGSWIHKTKGDVTLFLIVGSFILTLIVPPLDYLYHKAEPGTMNFILGGLLFVTATFFRAKGMLDLKRDSPWVSNGSKVRNWSIPASISISVIRSISGAAASSWRRP
jgi:hypothetical protein